MDATKNALDATVVSGSVTAPFWFEHLQTGTSILLAVGGVVYLALRIAIAWRDLRQRKTDR